MAKIKGTFRILERNPLHVRSLGRKVRSRWEIALSVILVTKFMSGIVQESDLAAGFGISDLGPSVLLPERYTG
jgi:hypothetical protein